MCMYIKLNLDQNVHATKNMNIKQNLGQSILVSIFKKTFLIQILIYNV